MGLGWFLFYEVDRGIRNSNNRRRRERAAQELFYASFHGSLPGHWYCSHNHERADQAERCANQEAANRERYRVVPASRAWYVDYRALREEQTAANRLVRAERAYQEAERVRNIRAEHKVREAARQAAHEGERTAREAEQRAANIRTRGAYARYLRWAKRLERWDAGLSRRRERVQRLSQAERWSRRALLASILYLVTLNPVIVSTPIGIALYVIAVLAFTGAIARYVVIGVKKAVRALTR
jgi:hypothetical protein